MSTELVRLAIVEGLATITLARPEAGNAMSWDLLDQFGHAAEAVVADGSVRAVLVEAEGRNFSVGGDIRAFAAAADPAGLIGRLARRLHQGVLALATLPAPVVVAVQGAAAGAGLSLAAGGDIVIAGRSANFSTAYTAIGLVSDGGATWLLPRLIGLRRTQEMAMLNRRLSAAEAEAYGLVTRVVDDEALADEARAIATKLAQGPTQAFAGVKRLLAKSSAADFATQLDDEAAAIAAAMATEDARGAVAAFLARQPAVFGGR